MPHKDHKKRKMDRNFSGKSPFEEQRFDLDQRLFVRRGAEDKAGGLVERYIGDIATDRIIGIGDAVTMFSVGDSVGVGR